ncbi:MAG: 2-oxoacid:acceptor oxidoreductase subunit alpha [Candidatus Kariarchaeaceae archaeon]
MTISETIANSFDGKYTLFNWLVGGSAGDGIFSAGNLFSKVITRNSYYCHYYTEYPSLIRGGHNIVTVRVSDQPISCQVSHIDILFAINLETIELHIDDVSPGGAVLYDPRILRRRTIDEFKRDDVLWKPVPLRDLAKSIGGAKVIQNTIGVAASIALVKLPFQDIANVIYEMFSHKPAIAEINVKAAELGYNHIMNNLSEFKATLVTQENLGFMMITGNTAISAGLISGGIGVFTGYPMSPATSVLETMVKYAQKYDYMTIQSEDEISAVTMAIGANHAGVRAATATSGGGLALMVEAIGLAGSAEIPLVVIDVMRPGPSTGLPTWTGQGDLLFAISLGQDSFPRAIITPGDVTDCFTLGLEALNLAEEYQIPIIILSDKWLGSSSFTSEVFSLDGLEIRKGKTILLNEESLIEQYKRFELTDDGISVRAIPGLESKMIFKSTGNEHDEFGMVEDSSSNRIKQMDKRMRKMEKLAQNLPSPTIFGVQPEDADLTIFSWGSNKGIILDVMNRLENTKISFIHTTYVWPFPSQFITEVLNKSKITVLVEQNFDAQFGQLINKHCLTDLDHKFLKYDGRPIDPAELRDQLISILESSRP